ncbi:MAG: DUF3786 domain-containing protein [Syntrophaceticus sp.]|nr:DUF3786 domain-containing protein [Syntrophaceticus sp.]MDD3315426.1 DUF3786 domain-containing protein [Syntrophaceticus sp.]MDD4358949.1 DUF3786 domain-containing protein [Syntrophaceticus sp.]MDD4782553.1 DUF3786 domain-containing protein [Syntrophaceticus sp.]
MYSDNYRQSKDEFAKSCPEQMAMLSGTEYDPVKKEFKVVYLNSLYFISHPEGLITCPDNPVDIPIVEQCLILQYLAQATGEPLAGRWISYAELPNGMFHDLPFRTDAIEPLARTFGGQPGRFLQVSRSLGGQELGIGDIGVVIPVFPRIPVAVILWVADEEFPARANMIFDASVSKYLTTAALHSLGATVTRHLKNVFV